MSLNLKNSKYEATVLQVVAGEDVTFEDGSNIYFSGLKIEHGGQTHYVGNEFEMVKLNEATRFEWFDEFDNHTRKSFTAFVNRTVFSTIENLMEYCDQARNPLTAINLNSTSTGGVGVGGGTSTVNEDNFYIHFQNTAASVWAVIHNLGKYPSVSIVDSANSEWEGEVQHLSRSELIISFTAPFAGRAYLN